MSEPKDAKINMDLSEKICVDAVELKTIEVRLSGVKEATLRSRYVFIVMTIVAATILISLWNSMLAFNRSMAFEKRSDITLIAENQKTITDEWLKNMDISVGLLGIRLGAFDLAVIGSSGLIVIMGWFFFSQRRENRAIVGLLRYCSDGFSKNKLSKDVCNLVFEGIVQSIVFIDMGGGDKPITGLIADDKSVSKAVSNSSIRAIMRGLTFLAPFTILAIVMSDISSLLIPSFLRESKEALWKVLFDGNHNIDVGKILFFELFALSSCVYTWILCRKCQEFSIATGITIEEFRDSILLKD